MKIMFSDLNIIQIQNQHFNDIGAEEEIARVTKTVYIPDEQDSEMLYLLDNGMTLCFRWYEDPWLTVGEELFLTRKETGIVISYGNPPETIELFGDPQGNYFQKK